MLTFELLFQEKDFPQQLFCKLFCRTPTKFLEFIGRSYGGRHAVMCISPSRTTCGFSTTSPYLPIVLVFFLLTALPEDYCRCKFSV